MITIDGKRYKVVESLGYQNGRYAKIVQTEVGERVAVAYGRGGPWEWHKPVVLPGGPITGQSEKGGES